MTVRIGIPALLLWCCLTGALVGLAQEPPPGDAEPLPDPPGGVVELAGSGGGEEADEAVGDEAAPPDAGLEPADTGGEEEADEAVEGEAAADAPEGLAEDEFELTADEVYYEAGAVYARGNVRLQHKDMLITGDEGEVDENGVLAQMTGNVVITSPHQHTTGTRLIVNLETEDWQLVDGETRLDPEYFDGQVYEPIFFRGKSILSYPRHDLIIVDDAVVTSCNHAEHASKHVHYDLATKRCQVRLRRDVILDQPTINAFGRRVFRYPGKLRLRMDDNRSRIIIEIGQNQVEGAYVKLGYPYRAGRSAGGLARLHLMTKRGIGAGVEHWFDTGQSAGEVNVFVEPSQGAWSTRLRHRYQFNRRLSTSFSNSMQTNSGYGLGTSTSLSSDFTVRNDTGGAHTTLGFQHSRTSGSGFSSSRFTNNLTHQQQGPAGLDWTLRSTMRRSEFGTDPAADEELELDLNVRRQQPAFDWELGLRQRHDLDGARFQRDNQYFALDQIPSIILRSDTERLGLDLGFPIETRAELGQFRQQPEDQRIKRASFLTEIYGERIRLAKGHELRTGAALRQSFYSEGSAQYDMRTSAEFESSWGGPWYTRVRWDWEQPHGFSPIRLDFATKRQDVQFDLSHYVADQSRIEFNTGFDIEESIWRDLVMRAEFTPNLRNRFEVQTAYDIERGEFRPLEARWQFVRQRRLDVSLAASYDIDEAELSRITLDSDWVVSPKWRFETLTGYNGVMQDLDFFEARVTRDLHCWIASLGYSLSQREIRLNFGLKALATGDWEYGLGGRGERLTTRQGQYF